MVVDQVSSTTSSLPPTVQSALSSLPGPLQSGVNTVLNTTSATLNKILPPSTRDRVQQNSIEFAQERPKLAAFILSQVTLSALPLFCFIVLGISVGVVALLAGVLIGLLGALIFIVGALAFALLILLPTLLVTTFGATFVWLFSLAAYYLVRWLNGGDLPAFQELLRTEKGEEEEEEEEVGSHRSKQTQAGGATEAAGSLGRTSGL